MIIFELNHNNFTNFIKILFLVSLLVLFDSFIQYTLGQNLFGNEYIDNRLTSVFGDEKVVGAFLTKIAFLVLIFPFLIFKESKYLNIIVFFLSTIFLVIVILSGERMASLLFIMGLTLYYLYKSF